MDRVNYELNWNGIGKTCELELIGKICELKLKEFFFKLI